MNFTEHKMRLLTSAALLATVFACFVLLTACDCGNGDDDDDSGDDDDDDDDDLSGLWCAALWGCFQAEVSISQSGPDATFSLNDGSAQGTGSIEGDVMTISGHIDGRGDFTMTVTFSEDGQSFSGEYEIAGDEPLHGRASARRGACEPLDPDQDGIPKFADQSYIDASKIARISRFRSGIGHDYSDSVESCRSMKHYFVPDPAGDWSELEIYAPVDGDVCAIVPESQGVQVKIRTSAYPEAQVILFHVNAPGLAVGDTVSAGEKIGTHVNDTTWSDIAVGFQPRSGWRLVSYFNVMTDDLFEIFENRGMAAREDAIITQAQRDADPLSCDGETFQDEGNIENWVDLD